MIALLKTFFIFFFLLFSFKELLAQKLILYTDNDSFGKVGFEKIWILARGEPAFANFFDLKVPQRSFLLTPKDKVEKLTLLRKRLFDPWFNTPRIAYEIRVKASERGDFLLCIEGDETLGEKNKVQKNYAKAVFHVEREFLWDRLCGFELEIKPFTRPYGLKKGALFRGQILYEGKPLKEVEVEVERLRLKLNPQELPKDSTGEINLPLFSKKVKSDDRGFFYTNFEEEGWWVLTVRFQRGIKAYGNKSYPFEILSHFWLYIFP